MQINRPITWASIHTGGLSLDGGSRMVALLCFSVSFPFGGTFSLCSTQEFSSSQPHELLEHLQLWGFKATISSQSISPSCEWNNIAFCTVWYLEVTQTSRAANMAIHVLLWIYCESDWPKEKITLTDNFHTIKDRASEFLIPLKPVSPPYIRA